MDEQLHMFMCLASALALVVIAIMLYTLVNMLSTGYATNGPGAWSKQGVWVPGPPQSLDLTAAAAGYNVEFSQPNQGSFSNRYEPPVFWNIGDINEYEKAQIAEARSAFDAIKAADAQNAAAAAAANPEVGYAFNPNYGYATDKLIKELY